jgi:DNA-binding LacI/PurR family transcriptional regulator
MVTMQDVATRANVSLSTVSYALNGTRKISDETRARIEAAMADLGYHRNAMARGLASRRSHVLALIFPATETGIGGTVSEFVTSAAAAAREAGYHLVLWPFGTHEAHEIRDLAQQGMADGVLLMEVRLDDPRVEVLHEAGVPYTMIGRTRELEGRPYVDIDFAATTEAAVDHLVALGHRRIAFINHSAASAEAGYGPTLRAGDGFAAAMERRGLDVLSLLCDETAAAGRAAVGDLLERDPSLTAVVTMNEIATFGVMSGLQSRGLAVPVDVSVLGIVSSPGVGAMSTPPLTTLHAPGAELGRRGVQSLLARIDDAGRAHAPVLVPCDLEAGASVGPAPVRGA